MTLRRTLYFSAALPLALGAKANAQVTVPLPQEGGTPASGEDVVDDRSSESSSNQAPAADSLASQIPIGEHGRPDINPYDRDIDMTVPLTFLSDSLGEIPMRLTADDRFLLDTPEFIRLVRSILNENAHAELSDHLQPFERFGPEELEGTGVALQYDPSTLAVVVLQVDPEKRSVRDLFAPPREDQDDISLEPADFSTYLNVSVSQTKIWERDGTIRPTISFDGAFRVGGIVFEGDGSFSERSDFNGESYNFERNFARAVYDQPDQYRRWFLGDLDPEIRGQQSFVSMGGVGVLRQQRRFNAFRSAVLQSNRELVIQRESTVRFLRNGALYRELRLQPGRYDFSSLPLIAGSNDIDIQVVDNSGAIQNLAYQQYLDPIDLDPGDFEYGAFLGPTSRTIAGAPDYQGPVAFTGFFRKAFFDKPAIGFGLQASKDVQTVTAQTQFILGNGGRLLLDGGASRSDHAGQGFAGGVSYEHFFDRSGLSDSFTLRADYVSSDFANLGNIGGVNSTAYTLSGQYTRQFDLRLTTTSTASYIKGRGSLGDSYRLGSTAYYRLNRRWTVRAGVEYSKFPTGLSNNTGFNVSVGLVFQPGYRRRAEARYESRNNLGELSYNQSGLNELNSLGFGGIVSRQDGQALAQGFAGYAANRFDASVSHASFGPSINDFGAVNATTARVGTTLAYADGSFGIGRRINDSFILLKPHENLGSRSVVAGQSLAENNYTSKSGGLGAALNNFLGSYSTQSVQYDVEEPPVGYDTGEGVFRVHPPYKSGYSARIGTDAFVSAMGTLLLAPNMPVSLAGGRVTLLDLKDGENPQPLPFFTNSVGRFAVPNLYPGRRYLIETYGQNGAIAYRVEFVVPEDTDGLVNLGEVIPGAKAPAPKPPQISTPEKTDKIEQKKPEESASNDAFFNRFDRAFKVRIAAAKHPDQIRVTHTLVSAFSKEFDRVFDINLAPRDRPAFGLADIPVLKRNPAGNELPPKKPSNAGMQQLAEFFKEQSDAIPASKLGLLAPNTKYLDVNRTTKCRVAMNNRRRKWSA